MTTCVPNCTFPSRRRSRSYLPKGNSLPAVYDSFYSRARAAFSFNERSGFRVDVCNCTAQWVAEDSGVYPGEVHLGSYFTDVVDLGHPLLLKIIKWGELS